MSTKALNLVSLPSQAGLNSVAPPTYLQPDELVTADNIYYGLSGERTKRPGTAAYNNTTSAGGSASYVASSSANVKSFSDFWRYGTSLVGSQRFVATGGTHIMASTGAGAWTILSSTWGTATSLIDNIVIAQGYAVFSNGVDTPQKWDQSTLSDVTTSSGMPKFIAAAYHQRRLYAIASTSPTVYLSAGGDITIWTGGDTAQFTLDEDDGDALLGVSKTFHKRLYFFKGPNFGSIHEISGNTLATLTRDKIFTGLPVLNNKGIVTTDNDIFWISRYGVHSLSATQKYGDTEAAFISFPIQDVFQTNLNVQRLNQAVGFWHPLRGIVGWFVTPSGQSTNQWALIYHYLMSDPTKGGKKFWSIWKMSQIAGYSAGVALTPAAFSSPEQPRLYIGGTLDGILWAGDQTVLSDAGTMPYAAKVKTGINLNFGQGMDALTEKQFYSVTTFFEPVGAYDHGLNIIVDNRVLSTSLSMTGGGSLFGASSLFGTATFGGNNLNYVESIINERGRSIQIEWTQPGANQDIRLHGWAVRAATAERTSMEPS